jgi:hypothetical protein
MALEQVDLADLGRTQLDAPLHLALGGPIESGGLRSSEDHPRQPTLYIRELVLSAIESRALVERSKFRHRTPGKGTSRLLDLVPAADRRTVAGTLGRRCWHCVSRWS